MRWNIFAILGWPAMLFKTIYFQEPETYWESKLLTSFPLPSSSPSWFWCSEFMDLYLVATALYYIELPQWLSGGIRLKCSSRRRWKFNPWVRKFPWSGTWQLNPVFSSVQSLSRVRICNLMNRSMPGLPVHHQLLEFTQTHAHRWCHPAISSSVVPFSPCPQSLPASESFPMSQLFEWGGESTGVSALASFLPKKSQGWSPSEWTGWTSLQSKGLSRVFSNTTVQKHQFFGAQPSSQSNSPIHTWPQEKP